MLNKKRIYLDYASITPIDRGVEKLMVETNKIFANPSSLYKEGVVAKDKLQTARKDVARLISALPDEIIFTSGGTEGNNMAIMGAYLKALELQGHEAPGLSKLHMIVSSIEHSSVLEVAKYLETKGVEVTYVEPDEDGVIDPKKIRDALRFGTFLVSVQMANNEIGTIQPIAEIAKSIRHFKKHISSTNTHTHLATYPLLHTDACQAFNYLEINTLLLHVDFLTLDGSKVYGPRGVGLLYKKRGVEICPIIHGGGQEMGLRSGTENLSCIIGFAEALKNRSKEREKEVARLKILQDYFFLKLKREIPEAEINGSVSSRLPNNINFCIPGLDSEFVVFEFDANGIAISSASSCLNKNENSFSYVVKAIKPNRKCEGSSLRISFGRTTKRSDIDLFFIAYSKISQISI